LYNNLNKGTIIIENIPASSIYYAYFNARATRVPHLIRGKERKKERKEIILTWDDIGHSHSSYVYGNGKKVISIGFNGI